jgi:ribose 5-phosphate isomerase B
VKIAIGSDHVGFKGKVLLAEALRSQGHVVEDVGSFSEESVDYPDYARLVSERVALGSLTQESSTEGSSTQGSSDRGVLLCGTGIGMSIAANKIFGVRAAVVWNVETARLAAEHNKANVLCLSGRLFDPEELIRMVEVWLAIPFGQGRHLPRIQKIEALDREKLK